MDVADPSMSQVAKIVDDSFQKALRMMKEAGYGVGDDVSVVADPDLPFMGYTFPSGGRFSIVVSGTAVDSGMLEGLLVHEMSHIYWMKSKHPSHDAEVINEAIGQVVRRGFDRDYQLKILHDVVNHLEDLYADDVAFKVFDGSRAFPADVASEFFQSWITDEPVRSEDSKQDRWLNASLMLRNSFALSNMTRHGTPDYGNKAKSLNERFLSQMPHDASRAFEYFHRVMTSLKEDVTEKEFRSLLNDYLEKFVEFAQGNHQTV